MSRAHSKIRVLDLFCGTGGISYGLKMGSGRFQVVGGVDLEGAAIQTARANHPGALFVHDAIDNVDPTKLLAAAGGDTIDVIVGGPPCQGFSSLRPSRGTTLDDPRNGLYMQYQRFVETLLPKVFLLENVVGLVNATRGALLSDLLSGFVDLGYRVDWRVLNAASFGVPQKRERFFLLGVHEDTNPAWVIRFPEPTHTFEGKTIGLKDRSRMVRGNFAEAPAVTAWEAISDLPSIASGESADEYSGPAQNAFQMLMRGSRASHRLSLHVAANHNEKMINVMRLAGANRDALPPGLVTSGYSSCYSRIDPNEPGPTITVKFTSPASSKCIHPYDDRAISPREAARLQSFPDGFVFKGSKTEIAHQLGNAVPPLLAAAFACVIEEALGVDDAL